MGREATFTTLQLEDLDFANLWCRVQDDVGGDPLVEPRASGASGGADVLFVEGLRDIGLEGGMAESDGCPAKEESYEAPGEEVRCEEENAGRGKEE